MSDENTSELETDPRFPSGPWTGYFLQRQIPGKHLMELRLTFAKGSMTGVGRDWVGDFVIRGQYNVADGECYWTKRYLGKHDVFYKGYNEGKGIWGRWDIAGHFNAGIPLHGGFHIWPEGMADPTQQHLHEEADLPAPEEDEAIIAVPAGAAR